MRTIGVDEINDIALGASLLGAGGGGDPYIGRLMAMQAVKECGPVTLIEPDEVPDDAFIAPCAMMGAPTVMTEKGGGKDDFDRLFDLVEQYSGQEDIRHYADGSWRRQLDVCRLPLPPVEASRWWMRMVWAVPFLSCRWSRSPSVVPRPHRLLTVTRKATPV